MKIFISYSHKDKTLMEELVKQLRVLQIHDNLEIWDDTRIAAGNDWQPEIENAINNANAAVLMISDDFLVSDFINRKEVPALLQKRAKGEMKIFPLIVYDCNWQEVKWLKGIQARPNGGKPFAELQKAKRKKILAEFALEIKRILSPKNDADDTSTETGTLPPHDGGNLSHNFKANINTLNKLPNTGSVFFGREKQLAV